MFMNSAGEVLEIENVKGIDVWSGYKATKRCKYLENCGADNAYILVYKNKFGLIINGIQQIVGEDFSVVETYLEAYTEGVKFARGEGELDIV